MICLACQRLTQGSICQRCRTTLRPAVDRILPGGVRLVAAFEHTGAARHLVHHLKYRGIDGYAHLVAEMVASRVPALPVVPVPRAWSRRLKYGVDPTRLLGRALADLLDVPVLDLLTPHVHTRRRAGRDHTRRVVGFNTRASPHRVILVDDVVTTGATVLSAVRSFGPERVATVVAANDATQGCVFDRQATSL